MSPTAIFSRTTAPPSFLIFYSEESTSATPMAMTGLFTGSCRFPPLIAPGSVGIPFLSEGTVHSMVYSMSGIELACHPKALL